MSLFKVLKTTWCRREFQSFWRMGGAVSSQYIEQDSFVVPSPDGVFSDFDCVILAKSGSERDMAQKFADHVARVGDDIKVAVVYI